MCFLSTIASASSASALSKVLLLLVYCSVVDPVALAWSNDLKSGTDFLCVTSNATTTTALVSADFLRPVLLFLGLCARTLSSIGTQLAAWRKREERVGK